MPVKNLWTRRNSMEGDLQQLADESAKKQYVVDDDGNVINDVEPKGELEESKEAADELEQGFQVPTRLKNMKKADLAESYLNLEKEKSRLGNEIGDLRKHVDELLKAPPVERKPIEAEQLLENPDDTLNSAISENEKIRELEDKLNQYESNNKQSRFYSRHNDADEIANSQEFHEYLQMQPIAAKAAAVASNTGDYDMLSDVLDSYKALQGKSLRDKSQQRREKELGDAQLESGSTGGSAKKVYTRNDLINMRIHEPEKYAANEAEIMKAYSEGRVK